MQNHRSVLMILPTALERFFSCDVSWMLLETIPSWISFHRLNLFFGGRKEKSWIPCFSCWNRKTDSCFVLDDLVIPTSLTSYDFLERNRKGRHGIPQKVHMRPWKPLLFAWCWWSSWIAVGLGVKISFETKEISTAMEGLENVPNHRPIIGILSQPLGPGSNQSYIAASYVKWIESSGSRVAPLLFDASEEELRTSFEAINGLVFPGGDASLQADSHYFRTLEMMFGWAVQANEHGDFFPVYGACLGMEALAILVSGNHSILSDTSAQNDPMPLHPVANASSSQFLRFLGKEKVDRLSQRSLAFENHQQGLLLESFRRDSNLQASFQLLTTSIDRNGLVYISSMEGKTMPILALQWHPEKNSFEWNTEEHIAHTLDAVEVSQSVGNYVVELARNSKHKPKSKQEEEHMLIYRYWPTFTGDSAKTGAESSFEQEYRFALRDPLTREQNTKVKERRLLSDSHVAWVW